MTLEQVAALLAEIHATYAGHPPTPQQTQSWHAALHDLTPSAAYARLTEWMREHHYRPTPADLRGVPRTAPTHDPPAPRYDIPTCLEPGCGRQRRPDSHLCDEHDHAARSRYRRTSEV